MSGIGDILLRRRLKLAIVSLLLLWPEVVAAQTAVDARIAEFTPSAEHYQVRTDGREVVTTYRLDIYRRGSTTVERSVDLGKPAPQSDGKIRVDFFARLTAPLATGVEYQSRVAAVGPGGSGVSELSNIFTYSAPCAPTLSSSSASVPAAGGSSSVGVSAGSGCAWTASSSASWLTITSGATGSGNGTVAFSAAANPGTASRSGTLTIAGHTFTVTQAAPCTYSISPTSQSLNASAQSTTVSVSAGTGCAWTSTSNASWLTISSGASGTGSGSVAVAVAANTATTSRSGTVTIAGQTFTVTQAAGCSYSISPSSQSLDASAQSTTVSVSAGTGCVWTSTSNAGWLTISSGASGTGSGSVAVAVAANTATTSRSGTVTIAGQTFTVTQAGVPCTYTVTPGSVLAPIDGMSGSLTVSTISTCTWSASGVPAWITASGGTRTGSGSWSFTVKSNTTGAARSAVITVAGQPVTISQEGPPVAPTAPSNLRITLEGGQ